MNSLVGKQNNILPKHVKAMKGPCVFDIDTYIHVYLFIHVYVYIDVYCIYACTHA